MSDRDIDALAENTVLYIAEQDEEKSGPEAEDAGEGRSGEYGPAQSPEEREEKRTRQDRALFGTSLAEVNMRNVVGYCRRHKCYITEHQIRRKECLKKHGRYLERIDGPFWEERERKKAEKKRKRAERGGR